MSTKRARTMTSAEPQTTLSKLCKVAGTICDVAATAQKGRQSLSGRNSYATKFHDHVLVLRKHEAEFLALAANVDSALLDDFRSTVACIRSDAMGTAARTERLRHLRTLCETKLQPLLDGMTANPIPVTEQVLPMEVVKGTRGYFEKWIRQANGCYEHQWFDACSVMLRKFVENLIIHVFEAHGFAEEIKRDGNFLMLGDLIGRMLGQTHWNLGRETKACLPEIKKLGDRAAHNRTFTANKVDVEKALDGFRVTAEELLHLAKLK